MELFWKFSYILIENHGIWEIKSLLKFKLNQIRDQILHKHLLKFCAPRQLKLLFSTLSERFSCSLKALESLQEERVDMSEKPDHG